jgi:hypothetical protein
MNASFLFSPISISHCGKYVYYIAFICNFFTEVCNGTYFLNRTWKSRNMKKYIMYVLFLLQWEASFTFSSSHFQYWCLSCKTLHILLIHHAHNQLTLFRYQDFFYFGIQRCFITTDLELCFQIWYEGGSSLPEWNGIECGHISFWSMLMMLIYWVKNNFFSTGFYSPYRTLAFLNGLLDPQTFGRTPWLGDQSNTRPLVKHRTT